MINASSAVKTILDQDTTLVVNAGCTVEYNMNTLVDNITLTGADITRTDASGAQYYPFKKLFPIDTIIKANRPQGAGIKYAIVGDVGTNTYRDPRTSEYRIDYRTYYPGVETAYKYYLSEKSVGLDVTATYPKTIYANKIVIKFELAHSTPPTWTVFSGATQIASGTSSDIKPFTTTVGSPPNQEVLKNTNAGTVVIYYNGTSWSTTQPTTIPAPVAITSLRLTTGAVSNKYIGLIELSPRWISDISNNLVDFSITKEASSGSEEILPVGSISANSVAISLADYSDIKNVISFDKTMTFDPTKIYLYKRIEISPYFKVYHSAGLLTDSNGKYDKINQGVFYADNWSIGEFGDITITGLDGAKILQETIAPGIVCRDYSIVAIIRTLLDNIGFTNYKFNLEDADLNIKSSSFSPRFWWTDDGRTVWESLQQLCRDSQMVALFDEDNVLQFYSREYIFNSAFDVDWTFRYDKIGNNLANIISFDKRDLATANQVKVIWNSVTTNNYTGSSQPLWKSSTSFLSALSLDYTIPQSAGSGEYMTLSAVVTNEAQQNLILNDYSGFLVINSEIIEYDAIQYEYRDDSGTPIYVDITNRSDALKYLGLQKAGSKNYQPNRKYRIKQRGAFGTTPATHPATANDIINSWSGYRVVWE